MIIAEIIADNQDQFIQKKESYRLLFTKSLKNPFQHNLIDSLFSIFIEWFVVVF